MAPAAHTYRIPQHKRLLTAWHRCQKLGITPGQLIVLADVVEHHTGPVCSMRHRAKRIHMTQAHVCTAYKHLNAEGLITLTPISSPMEHLHRSYPSLAAAPTAKALRLFNRHAKSHARPV